MFFSAPRKRISASLGNLEKENSFSSFLTILKKKDREALASSLKTGKTTTFLPALLLLLSL